MRSVTFTAVNLCFLLCVSSNAFSQSRDTKSTPPTASITGRVMLGEQPVAGVTVALSQRRSLGNQNTSLPKAVTDSEGRFHLTNIAAGVYLVAPLASLSGIVVLEQAAVADSKAKCEKQREATLEETLITLRKDRKGESLEQKWLNTNSLSAPNEKGEFLVSHLFAGSYRVSVNLPSETWYLKSETLSALPKSNQPNYRNPQPSDVASKGIAVKAGEPVATLFITIGEGAASLSGTVKAVSERQSLPPRLRVYLVPSEVENANNALRFFQSEVQFDGAFSFANLAPGKYFLLSRIGNEDELNDNTPRPIYWDTEGRALLRKEAEAINQLIELPPCKRVMDYSLRHGVVRSAVTPASKK